MILAALYFLPELKVVYPCSGFSDLILFTEVIRDFLIKLKASLFLTSS
jgi:hypothetical protein